MFSKAVKLQKRINNSFRWTWEKGLKKKYPTIRGKKSQPEAKGSECDFLEAAHTLLASETVTWQGGTPPKATSKVAWLVPGILIFGNPTFCVPEPDRQTVGREGNEDARAEKAAASRADPPEAAEPGRPATLRGHRDLSADPGRRRRPQRHPAHSQDFLKWVRLPSDFYGLNSAIKSNHSRIKQNKISSTRHSCRKVFSKNTRQHFETLKK